MQEWTKSICQDEFIIIFIRIIPRSDSRKSLLKTLFVTKLLYTYAFIRSLRAHFFRNWLLERITRKKKGKEKERYNVISPPSVRSPVLRHDYKERAVRLLLHEKEGRKVRWTVFSYVTYADTKDNRGPLASGSVFKQKSAIKHSTRDAREHFA